MRLEADEPLAAIHSPSHEIEIKRDGDRTAVIGVEARIVRAEAGTGDSFDEEVSATVREQAARKGIEYGN